MKSLIALDIEHSTQAFKPWEEGFYITCVCLATATSERVWWFEHSECDSDGWQRADGHGWDQRYQQSLNEIQEILDQHDVVIAHNLKHDMNILRYHGINFENIELWCTMVADYILFGQDSVKRWDLSHTAERHDVPKKLDKVATYWKRGVDTYDIPIHIVDEYVRDDASKLIPIYNDQVQQGFEQSQMQLLKLHMDYTRSLSDMELNGFNFDTELAEEYYEQYSRQFNKIQDELRSIAGDGRINFGSNSQLRAFLYGGTTKIIWYEWVVDECKTKPYSYYREKKQEEEVTLGGCGFSVPKRAYTKGGEAKTDKKTIEKLHARTKQQRLVKGLLLELSECKKIAETLKGKRTETGLLNKIQPDGRVHSSFNQTVTKTGRGSSSDPNGQNFPRSGTSPIKKTIIATDDEHEIAEYDLSQIEWKLAGELSQDAVMLYEINSGIDQHQATGDEIFEGRGERNDWKVFNFRMIYGGSEWGFYLDHKMPDYTIEEWRQICSAFYAKYRGLYEWQQYNIQQAWLGNPITLPTGRTFVFHKTKWKDGIWQLNPNHMKNYPVQGFAGGDILPLVVAMIRKGIMTYSLKSKLILTVHDSVVFDALLSEIAKLERLCTHVGDSLSQSIQDYFGYNTSVKNFGGEFKHGHSYGTIK